MSARRPRARPEARTPPPGADNLVDEREPRDSEGPAMKKLMNSPDQFVDEMLDGLVAAHPSLVRENRVIRAADAPRQGKVGIVSGGGSGHLPLFTGYVGRGLLDSCAIGDVFAGPSVDACAWRASGRPTEAGACCGSTATTAATG
jgi:dihydroxyacetone kinase